MIAKAASAAKYLLYLCWEGLKGLQGNLEEGRDMPEMLMTVLVADEAMPEYKLQSSHRRSGVGVCMDDVTGQPLNGRCARAARGEERQFLKPRKT